MAQTKTSRTNKDSTAQTKIPRHEQKRHGSNKNSTAQEQKTIRKTGHNNT